MTKFEAIRERHRARGGGVYAGDLSTDHAWLIETLGKARNRLESTCYCSILRGKCQNCEIVALIDQEDSP